MQLMRLGGGCGLLAIGILGALVGAAAGDPAGGLMVPEVKGEAAPVIDGRLDEAVWQNAARIEDFRVLGGQAAPEEKTVCRLLRDDRYLYLAVECGQKTGQPVAQYHGRDTRAVQDDSLEIFLGPGKGSGEYAHFVLGAGNGYYEQKVVGRNHDREWSVSWRKQAVVAPGGWTAEIAIPLYVIGIGGLGGNPVFNVCRNLVAPSKQFITWALLGTGYHEPASFRELAGFQGISVAPVCDARIRRAVAESYRVSDGAFRYRLELTIENNGGKAGEVGLKLKDCPAAGDEAMFEKKISVPPIGSTPVTWDVPVKQLDSRTAQLAVGGDGAEWIAVPAMDNLTPLSVFFDRNYYTRETQAVLVCRAIFDQAQSRANGFRYRVAVRRADGQEVFSADTREPDRETRVSIPVGKLDPGVYQAEVKLIDAASRNLASVRAQLQRYAPGPATEVKFDQIREVILVNNEPFFPFGFMDCNDLTDERLMQKIASAGFNTLVRWNGTVGGYQTDKLDLFKAGLDLAEKYKLKVFEPALAFGPSIGYGMKDIDKAFDATLAGLEKALPMWRAHPAVIGYYGLDEPGGAELLALAEKMYAVCHRLDPYRPLYSSNCGDWQPEAYGYFDLLGRHGYYMPLVESTSRSYCGTLKKLSLRCAVMAELAAHYHRPFMATPQFCWREEIRKITPHEMRCCYFLPLIRGAKGLIFFIYNDATCHPAEWQALKNIAAEIRRLIPILVELSPPQNITCEIKAAVEGASQLEGPAAVYTDFKPIVQTSGTAALPVIQALIKNHPDGGEVIIAANSEEADREVTFKLSSIGAKTKVVDFYTEKSVKVRDGAFQTRMNGYEVRVFRTLKSIRKNPDDVVTLAVNAPFAEETLATPAPDASRANLLAAEGGFEGDAINPRWQVQKNTAAALSAETPHSGKTCLAVELASASTGNVTIPKVPLKAQTRYRLSAWFRSRMTEGKDGATLMILVPNQFQTLPRLALRLPQNQPEWKQFGEEFVTREAVEAQLGLAYPAGQGRVDCDDLALEELGPVAAEEKGNRIMNASFEEATYFGVPDGWMITDWTDDQKKDSRMYERQVKGGAVHGAYCARSGHWLPRYPLGGGYPQFKTMAGMDCGTNYVFSIYLKADRDGVPFKLVCREAGYNLKDQIKIEKEMTLGKEWRRYALELPLAEKKRIGKREFDLGVTCGKPCIVFADAAQLEAGLTPTDFQVDEYKAVDIGPAYRRAAVLAGE